MIEVLFIDDHVNEIEPVARTLQLRTGLRAVCTDKVDEALEFVRSEHVKVAVLDQRMEERLDLTGTELYDKIRAIDKRVRGIIFSGEADKADVVEANARGLRYLDKGCTPEELAQEVLTQRAQYLAEAERDHDRSAAFVGRYRGQLWPIPGQVVELLTIEDLTGAPEAREDDYVTVYEIGSGQSLRRVGTVVVEQEVQIERESQEDLESALKLGSGPVKELSTRVRASIKERSVVHNRARTENTLEETAALSEADEQAGVVHRRIEMAPTFVRRRALMRITCECCGERRIVTLNLRQWSGRYHRRQIDTYRDKAVETYDLGDR